MDNNGKLSGTIHNTVEPKLIQRPGTGFPLLCQRTSSFRKRHTMDALKLQLHLYASHLCEHVFKFPDNILFTTHIILHNYWQKKNLNKFAKDYVHATIYLATKLSGLHHDYEKDFARFVYQKVIVSKEEMKCLEMDIIHQLEYSMMFINPYTLLCGYFLKLQEDDPQKILDFENAKRLLKFVLNREEWLKYDIHHLVKSSLLQDSELSQSLNTDKDIQYDENLLQLLLNDVITS